MVTFAMCNHLKGAGVIYFYPCSFLYIGFNARYRNGRLTSMR